MSIEKLRSALAQGTEHIGDLCWWTLADAVIARSKLETIWATAGMPEELLPEPPTAEKALKTAVREAALGRPEVLIRLGLESETEVIFAVVREERLGDGSVRYTQEAKVRLDRNSKQLETDTPTHPVIQEVRSAFERLSTTHTPDDVRRTVIRALHSYAAVTLREHGGIYWLSPQHSAQVRRLQRAVESIGSSKLYLLPVHETAEGRRALADAAKGALEDELSHLQTEIDGFLANPPERTSTLVRRFDAFEGLRARAELYRDVLRVHVDDLESRLNAMAASVEKLLVAKSAA